MPKVTKQQGMSQPDVQELDNIHAKITSDSNKKLKAERPSGIMLIRREELR